MKRYVAYMTGKILLIVIFITLGILLFIPVFTYIVYAGDLRSKDTIMNRNNVGLILQDREEEPFFTFYQGRRESFVSLSKIPKHTQEAVIATEDKEFYKHPGFSLRGIVRSVLINFSQKEIVAGGSTITQQLVKNALLSSRRDFLRKYQELILAQEIERRYTKDEILEMYLNSVYFGEGAFGIAEAAKNYFGKEPKNLTLAESAMLTGVLPAPTQYSPVSGNKQKAIERQEIVLDAMEELGYITATQKNTALKENIIYSSASSDLNQIAPHFAVMVRDQLIEKYGEQYVVRSGMKVKTTLNRDWQVFAEKTLQDQVDKLAGNNVSNGAAVVIDPNNGEIRALVGSKDWYDDKFGKVNMITTPRQPGSSFKPIVYGLALEDGSITPATVLHDKPTTFEGNYSPKNYDRRFRGPMTIRRALANSLNIPAVEVMTKVGVPAVLRKSTDLGITTLRDAVNYGPSLVLGTGEVPPLELTAAYGSFATGGIYTKPTALLEIKDKNDKTIFKHHADSRRVWEPETAFTISSILSDNRVRAELFGNALTISRQAAVKTGTTDDYKDAWTVGYTPQLVIGVWVGNNNNQAMSRIAGSLGAAPIWRTLMTKFLREYPQVTFTPPNSMSAVPICSFNGGRSQTAATSSAHLEYFVKGNEPRIPCFVPSPTSGDTPTPDPNQQSPTNTPSAPSPTATTTQPTEVPPNEKPKKKDVTVTPQPIVTEIIITPPGLE